MKMTGMILTAAFCLAAFVAAGQESVRAIYMMRPKQFFASGAKMEIVINGELVYKLGNGQRILLRSQTNDTLRIQAVCPTWRKYRSEIFTILPSHPDTVYLHSFYGGDKFYNPLKHSGSILGPHGKPLEFNVNIERLNEEAGENMLFNAESFKDKSAEIPVIEIKPSR